MSYNFDNEYIAECILRLRINAIVAIPLNIISFYFIYFYTPKSMGVYKYYLINISCWSFMLDFYTEIFYTPILLSSTTALCSEGILKGFKDITVFHLPIFATLLGCCGASCLAAMIFRFFSITSSVNKLHNKTGFTILALLHFVGLPAGIGYIYIQSEKNDKLIIMQKNYPTIYEFYQQHTCTSTLSDTVAFKVVFMIAIFTFGSIGAVYGYVSHRTLRSLRLSKSVMSHRTYVMHVKMYLILLYQSFLPLGCLAIPTVLAMYLGYIGYEDTRYLNPWIFQIITMHSMLNSIGIILFVDKYRKAFYEKFFVCKKRNTSGSLFVNVVLSGHELATAQRNTTRQPASPDF